MYIYYFYACMCIYIYCLSCVIYIGCVYIQVVCIHLINILPNIST